LQLSVREMSKSGEEWTRGYRDMLIEAGSRALADCNLHGEEIDGIVVAPWRLEAWSGRSI